MSEKLNSNIKRPEVSYVTIQIKRTKKDENGRLYEVVEEQQVPDFIANILTGTGNIFVDDK